MSAESAGVPVTSPPPTEPPRYPGAPPKVSRWRSWSVEDAVDGGFFLAGAALVLWLGVLLLVKDLSWSAYAVVFLVGFWLLVAYIGLPRLQEVLARIYVPDYFIGRTVTGDGVLGDPVNLALDGTEAQVHAAMADAGWVRADEVTLRSSWGIVVSALLRRSYPAAPVSPLLVFGRHQAFAYEQEVDGNASQRHHVRFWPTPDGWSLPGGFRVDWLAAATYDRRVGLSDFTLQVTHRVAADIDVERDYVVATLRYARPETPVRVIEGFSAAFRARNGGGDVVHTDGNLPIVDLETSPSPAAADAPATSAPSHRRLAPPGLLLSGLLTVVKAGVTVLGLLAVLLGSPRARWFPEVSSAHLALTGASAAAIIVLWVLVLTHRRWARTVLMTICAVEAIAQLVALEAARHVSLLVLVTTSISVLILIAVTSDSARRWVAADPRPHHSS